MLGLAAGQGGVFLTRQAAGLGVGPVALVRLVRDGTLRHPARGLYAVTALIEPTPEGWHRQLSRGGLMLYPDALLDGVSAVLAHAMPAWGVPLERPALLRPIDRAAGVKGFRIRPASERGPVMTDLGPALPIAEAVVRLCIDNGTVPGVVSADAAMHAGLVTADELAGAVERTESWPRSSRARAMLTFVDARSESVGESIVRVEAALRGIPLIPQVEIRGPWGGLVGRVDFVVEGTKVIVEFDGKIKYAAGDPQVLWAEKRREDRLRELGYIVVRVTWADLARPERVVARIRRAMFSASA